MQKICAIILLTTLVSSYEALPQTKWSRPIRNPQGQITRERRQFPFGDWIPLSQPCPTCRPLADPLDVGLRNENIGLVPPKPPTVTRQVHSEGNFFPQDESSILSVPPPPPSNIPRQPVSNSNNNFQNLQFQNFGQQFSNPLSGSSQQAFSQGQQIQFLPQTFLANQPLLVNGNQQIVPVLSGQNNVFGQDGQGKQQIINGKVPKFSGDFKQQKLPENVVLEQNKRPQQISTQSGTRIEVPFSGKPTPFTQHNQQQFVQQQQSFIQQKPLQHSVNFEDSILSPPPAPSSNASSQNIVIPGLDKEEIQLLYVPVETLRQKGNLQGQKLGEQSIQFGNRPSQRPISGPRPTEQTTTTQPKGHFVTQKGNGQGQTLSTIKVTSAQPFPTTVTPSSLLFQNIPFQQTPQPFVSATPSTPTIQPFVSTSTIGQKFPSFTPETTLPHLVTVPSTIQFGQSDIGFGTTPKTIFNQVPLQEEIINGKSQFSAFKGNAFQTQNLQSSLSEQQQGNLRPQSVGAQQPQSERPTQQKTFLQDQKDLDFHNNLSPQQLRNQQQILLHNQQEQQQQQLLQQQREKELQEQLLLKQRQQKELEAQRLLQEQRQKELDEQRLLQEQKQKELDEQRLLQQQRQKELEEQKLLQQQRQKELEKQQFLQQQQRLKQLEEQRILQQRRQKELEEQRLLQEQRQKELEQQRLLQQRQRELEEQRKLQIQRQKEIEEKRRLELQKQKEQEEQRLLLLQKQQEEQRLLRLQQEQKELEEQRLLRLQQEQKELEEKRLLRLQQEQKALEEQRLLQQQQQQKALEEQRLLQQQQEQQRLLQQKLQRQKQENLKKQQLQFLQQTQKQQQIPQQISQQQYLSQQVQQQNRHTLPVNDNLNFISQVEKESQPDNAEQLVPHQPPLSVFFRSNNGENAQIADVLKELRHSNTITVLDQYFEKMPKVFVGPAGLIPPTGYGKFELPYLSNLDTNRIERKIDRLPFFVAPLNFIPPAGYSKIPFPAPHVGSVVVSSENNPAVKIKTTEKENNVGSYEENVSGSFPMVGPELPGLINSLGTETTTTVRPTTFPSTPSLPQTTAQLRSRRPNNSVYRPQSRKPISKSRSTTTSKPEEETVQKVEVSTEAESGLRKPFNRFLKRRRPQKTTTETAVKSQPDTKNLENRHYSVEVYHNQRNTNLPRQKDTEEQLNRQFEYQGGAIDRTTPVGHGIFEVRPTPDYSSVYRVPPTGSAVETESNRQGISEYSNVNNLQSFEDGPLPTGSAKTITQELYRPNSLTITEQQRPSASPTPSKIQPKGESILGDEKYHEGFQTTAQVSDANPTASFISSTSQSVPEESIGVQPTPYTGFVRQNVPLETSDNHEHETPKTEEPQLPQVQDQVSVSKEAVEFGGIDEQYAPAIAELSKYHNIPRPTEFPRRNPAKLPEVRPGPDLVQHLQAPFTENFSQKQQTQENGGTAEVKPTQGAAEFHQNKFFPTVIPNEPTTRFPEGPKTQYRQDFSTGQISQTEQISSIGQISSVGQISPSGQISSAGKVSSVGQISPSGQISSAGQISSSGQISSAGQVSPLGQISPTTFEVPKEQYTTNFFINTNSQKPSVFTGNSEERVPSLTDSELYGIQTTPNTPSGPQYSPSSTEAPQEYFNVNQGIKENEYPKIEQSYSSVTPATVTEYTSRQYKLEPVTESIQINDQKQTTEVHGQTDDNNLSNTHRLKIQNPSIVKVRTRVRGKTRGQINFAASQSTTPSPIIRTRGESKYNENKYNENAEQDYAVKTNIRDYQPLKTKNTEQEYVAKTNIRDYQPVKTKYNQYRGLKKPARPTTAPTTEPTTEHEQRANVYTIRPQRRPSSPSTVSTKRIRRPTTPAPTVETSTEGFALTTAGKYSQNEESVFSPSGVSNDVYYEHTSFSPTRQKFRKHFGTPEPKSDVIVNLGPTVYPTTIQSQPPIVQSPLPTVESDLSTVESYEGYPSVQGQSSALGDYSEVSVVRDFASPALVPKEYPEQYPEWSPSESVIDVSGIVLTTSQTPIYEEQVDAEEPKKSLDTKKAFDPDLDKKSGRRRIRVRVHKRPHENFETAESQNLRTVANVLVPPTSTYKPNDETNIHQLAKNSDFSFGGQKLFGLRSREYFRKRLNLTQTDRSDDSQAFDFTKDKDKAEENTGVGKQAQEDTQNVAEIVDKPTRPKFRGFFKKIEKPQKVDSDAPESSEGSSSVEDGDKTVRTKHRGYVRKVIKHVVPKKSDSDSNEPEENHDSEKQQEKTESHTRQQIKHNFGGFNQTGRLNGTRHRTIVRYVKKNKIRTSETAEPESQQPESSSQQPVSQQLEELHNQQAHTQESEEAVSVTQPAIATQQPEIQQTTFPEQLNQKSDLIQSQKSEQTEEPEAQTQPIVIQTTQEPEFQQILENLFQTSQEDEGKLQESSQEPEASEEHEPEQTEAPQKQETEPQQQTKPKVYQSLRPIYQRNQQTGVLRTREPGSLFSTTERISQESHEKKDGPIRQKYGKFSSSEKSDEVRKQPTYNSNRFKDFGLSTEHPTTELHKKRDGPLRPKFGKPSGFGVTGSDNSEEVKSRNNYDQQTKNKNFHTFEVRKYVRTKTRENNFSHFSKNRFYTSEKTEPSPTTKEYESEESEESEEITTPVETIEHRSETSSEVTSAKPETSTENEAKTTFISTVNTEPVEEEGESETPEYEETHPTTTEFAERSTEKNTEDSSEKHTNIPIKIETTTEARTEKQTILTTNSEFSEGVTETKTEDVITERTQTQQTDIQPDLYPFSKGSFSFDEAEKFTGTKNRAHVRNITADIIENTASFSAPGVEKQEHQPVPLSSGEVIPTTTESRAVTYEKTEEINTETKIVETTTESLRNIEFESTAATEAITIAKIPKLIKTSTTTKISHETEICYKGKCIRTRSENPDDDLKQLVESANIMKIEKTKT